MNNKEITVEEKIDVLDTVYMGLFQYIAHGHTLYPDYHYGLCRRITSELKRQLDIEALYADIPIYFKDFTYDNAVKFGADNHKGLSAYWWHCGYIQADHENRLKFLEWMINRLKNGEEGYEQ